MCTGGTIQMIANIAIALAVIFSGIMLFLNHNTNKLHKLALEPNLFNNITKRINELYDNMPEKNKDDEWLHWYLSAFNAFEYFCFFANNNYLSSKIKPYYKGYIIYLCSDLESKCPKVITYIKEQVINKFLTLVQSCRLNQRERVNNKPHRFLLSTELFCYQFLFI